MDPHDASISSLGAIRSRLPLPPKTLIGFLLAVVAVAIIAVLCYQSLLTTTQSAAHLTQTMEVLGRVRGLLSTVVDAETGQRGFLLTGEESYLTPYTDAKDVLPDQIKSLRALFVNRPEQRRLLDDLESLVNLKMAELESTIAARRAGRPEAALAMIRTDRGKIYMDRIRAAVSQMETVERQLIARRAEESRSAATVSLAVTLGGAGLLLFLIAGAALVASQDFRIRQAQAWIKSGQMGLSEQMQGDQSLEKLGGNLLSFLARFVEAQVGAAYIADAGQYRRFAAYAMAADASVQTVRPGDGLVGQAARDKRALRVRDVPAGYLPISSAIGTGTPNELVVLPASVDGVVQAVVELGFFGATSADQRELLSRVSESIAVAVRAAKDRNASKNCCRKPSARRKNCRPARKSCASATRNWRNRGARCGNRRPIWRCSNRNSSRSTRSWRSRRSCSSIRRTSWPGRRRIDRAHRTNCSGQTNTRANSWRI